MKQEQNFERELPSGYRQAKYINAKNAKFGIIFNLIALLVFAVVMVVAVLLLLGKEDFSFVEDVFMNDYYFLALLVFCIVTVGYVVLHELVHGIAYKALTGEKLTFGISWSCAFCGVPHIYTYRRTAIISVVAPFAVFTLLLLSLLILFYFISPMCFLFCAAIFGLHTGGCSGDLYVLGLFLFKFRDKRALMRDTGPEQYFYVPQE